MIVAKLAKRSRRTDDVAMVAIGSATHCLPIDKKRFVS